MNIVIVSGNLGKDPEVRATSGGSSVCNFSLACNERRKDRDGNWSDHVEWVPVACFGKTAENVGTYLKKGSKALVRGKFQTRKWTDKDGKDRYRSEVIADEVDFLSPKEGGGGGRREEAPSGGRGGYGGGGYGGGGGGQERPPNTPRPGDDEEIPFCVSPTRGSCDADHP